MKYLGVVVCFLMCAGLFVGCSDTTSSEPSVFAITKTTEKVVFDSSIVTTVGDSSYLPINKSGRPSSMTVEILGAINAFKVSHPELVVDGWAIEKQQDAYLTGSYVYGLWVNHHPRDTRGLSAEKL